MCESSKPWMVLSHKRSCRSPRSHNINGESSKRHQNTTSSHSIWNIVGYTRIVPKNSSPLLYNDLQKWSKDVNKLPTFYTCKIIEMTVIATWIWPFCHLKCHVWLRWGTPKCWKWISWRKPSLENSGLTRLSWLDDDSQTLGLWQEEVAAESLGSQKKRMPHFNRNRNSVWNLFIPNTSGVRKVRSAEHRRVIQLRFKGMDQACQASLYEKAREYAMLKNPMWSDHSLTEWVHQ